MRTIILLIVLKALFFSAPAHSFQFPQLAPASEYSGKLDLTPDFEAFGARSFTDNEYIGGFKKRIWHFDRSGVEEFRVALFVAANTARVIGGPSIGFPGGGIDKILDFINSLHSLPPSVMSVQPYLAYLKGGVNIGYDPSELRGFKPVFLGYSLSVAIQ